MALDEDTRAPRLGGTDVDVAERATAAPRSADSSTAEGVITLKQRRFLAEPRSTPFLVLDLDVVEASYRALADSLPGARVFYAVKANPAPLVLERLAGLGAAFDVASPSEIVQALAAGADPARLSYGNTIKKEADIAKAYAFGVRLFAFDSPGELEKLGRSAPGSRVFCRILTSGEGADWPLSKKFGCAPSDAAALLARARGLGLVPAGVSFHVGSQQRDPAMWDKAIGEAAGVFRALEASGIEADLLNLGGGFPARLRAPVPEPAAYGRAIRQSVRRHFGGRTLELILEPGRGLVGDAGVIQTEVVLIADKPDDPRRWVFLDVGKFNGLAETMEEAIRYPVVSDRTGAPARVVLAGPTCDSADVLYERADYRLPTDLRIGDRLEIRATGAYTTTYSTIAFNGFPPLVTYCI